MRETTKLLIVLAVAAVVGFGTLYAVHKATKDTPTIVTFKVVPCTCPPAEGKEE